MQAPAITSTYYNVSNGAAAITLPNCAVAFLLTAYTVEAGDYTRSGHDTLNLDVNGSIGPDDNFGWLGNRLHRLHLRGPRQYREPYG